MIQLEKKAGIASIIFDNPDSKVNVLKMTVMEKLAHILEDIDQDSSLKACIVKSNKDDIFIAGADISEIIDITSKKEAYDLVRKGQAVLDKLAALSIPTVAVINGACLGGGCELALACDFRIATQSNKTQMGLPEVNLGIIPGFGGTQRLSRLIGLPESLKLVLSGKAIDGKKALTLNLVDAWVPHEFLDTTLDSFLLTMVKKPTKIVSKRQSKRSTLVKFSEHFFLTRQLLYIISKKSLLKKTKGFYPAPEKALKAVVGGFATSLKNGLKKEAILFSECIETKQFKQLSSLFFSQEEQKKLYKDKSISLLDINQAAVIGAGLMGSGIAWSLSYSNIPTILKDINYSFVSKGMKSILGIYKQLLKIRKVTKRELIHGMHKVDAQTDYSGFNNVNVVIEAVLEDMDLKKKVYAELEEQVSNNTIIATNTSSLCVDALSSSLKYPERFVGVHFFSPVNRMPLVEIIPSKHTSKEVLNTVINCVRKMKKTPVVVGNCPGFLVNRVLLPYVNEAMNCLIDGAGISQIDSHLTSFGMPVGPLSLADEVGLDVGLKVLEVLESGYGDRMAVDKGIKELYQQGDFKGKKTGKGFYIYKNKMKQENMLILKKIKSKSLKLNRRDLIDRCIYMMINEAARCLDEKVISDARELDLAMIYGTGFPPFRGGLCKYADSIGLDKVVERLNDFAKQYGDRFIPCDYLRELANKSECFYKREAN